MAEAWREGSLKFRTRTTHMGSTSSTDACAGAVRSHANTGSSSRFASSRELPTCAPTCSTSKRLSNDTAPQPLARKAARARSARACAAHRPSQPLGVRSLWHMAYARPCPKSDSSRRNLRSNWFPSMAAGTVTALSHAAARRRSRVADVARRIYHRRWRCMRELRSAVRTGALILSIDRSVGGSRPRHGQLRSRPRGTILIVG